MKKYTLLTFFILIKLNLIGQTPIDSLPTIFSDKVKSLKTTYLKVGSSYYPNVKTVKYSYREKKKGNIDTLLCKYHDLLYLNIKDENFDFDLLKCVKDSLKYMSLFSSFSESIYFELPNLEEVVGKMDMKLLSTLLSNSPKFVAGEIMATGKIEQLEGVKFNNLRWFAIDSEEGCFCKNDLTFPESLLNAPNLEILMLRHYCKRNILYKDKYFYKYFEMPEIKSDSSKLTYLEIYGVDIANPHTLEQIKKLKNLETLYISFSGSDFSIFDDLQYIEKIYLNFTRGRRYQQHNEGEWTDTNSEAFRKKYPNIN